VTRRLAVAALVIAAVIATCTLFNRAMATLVFSDRT
jgi:hypothetical protein